jgi:DNA helicase HerA-like ATPase
MRLQIVLSDFEDPTRDLMSATIGYALQKQRENPHKPHVMFVIDEAHEFVPQTKGESSWAIERLAREGRKLHLGLLMASQRCTYLNTSVMAQLGTVFFTSLKMRTDRERIEQAFDIDRELIDSSTLLGPREWYVVSGHATGLKGYPILLEAPDVIVRLSNEISE